MIQGEQVGNSRSAITEREEPGTGYTGYQSGYRKNRQDSKEVVRKWGSGQDTGDWPE
jgi:hypothetical protein